MDIMIHKSIDSFGSYGLVNKKTKLESVYNIEIFTLKQILEIIIRVSWEDPIFITKRDNIFIYIKNKYISTWIIVENLWGYFDWIKNIFFETSDYYTVDLSDIELLYRDILSKRRGFKKYVKIAFTGDGFVYKNNNCNLSLKRKENYSIEMPFNYNLKSINYMDGEIFERRKIINMFYPELLDILTYFPVRYNKDGISYITDRFTILGFLTRELKKII